MGRKDKKKRHFAEGKLFTEWNRIMKISSCQIKEKSDFSLKKTQVRKRTREKTEKQSLSQLVNAFHRNLTTECLHSQQMKCSKHLENKCNKQIHARMVSSFYAFYFARFHYCIIFMHVVDMVFACICRWLFMNGLNFYIMCHFSIA